jgi:hypothetical protein
MTFNHVVVGSIPTLGELPITKTNFVSSASTGVSLTLVEHTCFKDYVPVFNHWNGPYCYVEW